MHLPERCDGTELDEQVSVDEMITLFLLAISPSILFDVKSMGTSTGAPDMAT